MDKSYRSVHNLIYLLSVYKYLCMAKGVMQMITSRLDGKIVYIDVDGPFSAEGLYTESKKWLDTHRDEYVGYLVDISKMTEHSAVEKRKAEELTRQLNSGKPRAVFSNDSATSTLLNIYMRFTNAKGIKYFSSIEDAKSWLLAQA
jgi:hypothetical protein